jgi:hypothetical protein
MTAKIDDKRPRVKANGAAITIAWVFKLWIYKIRRHMINTAMPTTTEHVWKKEKEKEK